MGFRDQNNKVAPIDDGGNFDTDTNVSSVTSTSESAANALAAANSAAAALVSENNSDTSETNAAASAAAALVSENNAATSETNAATSETNAATSATAAATSSSDTETAKLAAQAAQAAAETAETNAETAETNAETAETNAATSATNASNSATAAANSATASSNSATASETSRVASVAAQTAAETAETNAETAETNAETAQTAAETAQTASETAQTGAETAETNAAASQVAAATSATNAGVSETNAATSATNAATSETNAATSESNAATSAGNAAISATAASNSQVAAASSAASAASVFDQFDDTYLGSKSSAPTVDNDGDALVVGALYYSSTLGGMQIWDGSEWIDASSAGGASLTNYNFTATAGQTVFSGADDNSNTLAYTVDNIILTLNGVVLEDNTDYTATNGSSITLSVAASLDDELNIVAFKTFTTADMVSASNGGTFQGNVDFTAGIDVTGNITVTGTVDGVDVAAFKASYDALDFDGDYVNVTGDTMTGDLSFGDNDKAIFGAGSDLQIYHDGLNSYIADVGTGDLKIQGANVRLENPSGVRYFQGSSGNAYLYNSGDIKLATTSTGVDVTGTITSDGLTVDGDVTINSAFPRIFFYESDTTNLNSTLKVQGGSLLFQSLNDDGTGTTSHMAINNSTGDISFYEDTGTTPKFFWDASAESLGIGTDTPSAKLDINQLSASTGLEVYVNDVGTSKIADLKGYDNTLGVVSRMVVQANGNVGIGTSSPSSLIHASGAAASGGAVEIRLEDTAASSNSRLMRTGSSYSYAGVGANETWLYHAGAGTINIGPDGAGAVKIVNNGAERMRIDSNGNVGIGVVPSATGGGYKALQLGLMTNWGFPTSGSAYRSHNLYYDGTNRKYVTTGTAHEYEQSSAGHVFSTAASGTAGTNVTLSEAMRIDNSGNLLVGTTQTFPAFNNVVGCEVGGFGQISASRDGAEAMQLNRKTSDGDIALFKKDGTTVGSIAVTGTDDLTLYSSATGHKGLRLGQGYYIPTRSDGAPEDATVDIGLSAYRYKDAYFSGTVNAANFNTTSDATLKTNVETLSGSLDAVTSLRGVSFDWLDNGGSEIGVIAQEVEAVLPDVVSTNDEGIKSVKYSNMVAVLIEAIKEQQLRIEALEAQLNS